MSILWKGLVWKEEGKKRLLCESVGRSNEGGLEVFSFSLFNWTLHLN